ncbi:Stress response protein nst1 [Geranomyces michiganensis]|nr:Stress response protein nst1 [Geranomyces michiganensis]
MPLVKRKKQKKKAKPTTGHSPEHVSASSNGAHVAHHDEDDDDDFVDNGSYDARGRGVARDYASSNHQQSSTSPGDEAVISDDDGYVSPHYVATDGKKKKKKKKRASDAGHNHRHPDIWYKSDAEEKQRIREFWLQLGEEERRALVKLEKEAVLKKMKEQQKQTCSCSVCGRKRTVIEEELEILYDAYYEELENFANDQGPKSSPGPATPQRQLNSSSQYRPPPPLPLPSGRIEHEMRDEDGEYDDEDEDEEDDEDEDDDDDDLDDYEHDPSESIFEFGSSLTVKGGILTVADDFLKNDGRKFLDLMEQLAERKIRQLDDEMDRNGDANGEWDDADYDEEEYDEEEEEDSMTEEQRMEEGRRMFQIFAAKMFEQRVLQAYREKVAQERQMHLLAELEKEKELQVQREATRQKNKEKKRQQKKVQKQQKEEERLALERKKQEEEDRLRQEKAAKQEADRLRREAEKARKEEERLRKEEEERKKREAEKQRKDEEKRKNREAEEKRRREKEERMEKERREREEKERKEVEAREQKERQRKLDEEREKREREEKERQEALERSLKEKREQDELRAWQQQQQQQSQASVTAQRAGRPGKAAQGTRQDVHSPVANAHSQPQPRAVASGRPAPARPVSRGAVAVPPRAGRVPQPQPPPLQPTPPPQAGYQAQQQHAFFQKPVAANSFPSVSSPGQPRQQQQHIAGGPSLPPHSIAGFHTRPSNPMAMPAFALPVPRPGGVFPGQGVMHGLHPQAMGAHGQQPHGLHGGGQLSPPPPIGIAKGSEIGADTGLFNNAGFAPLHWATEADGPAHVNPLTESSLGLHANPQAGLGIAPIGSSKAITRPAPIRRPSAIGANPDGSRSAIPDDTEVAGSASLGGDILNDNERIGGGAAWRSSAMRKTSLQPSTSASLPSAPLGIPMMPSSLDSAFAAPSHSPQHHHNNAVRMFEGFTPFGTSWDAPQGGGFEGRPAESLLSPPGPGMGFFPAYMNAGAQKVPPSQHQQQQPQQHSGPTLGAASAVSPSASAAIAAPQMLPPHQQGQPAQGGPPPGPWSTGRDFRF